MAFKKRGGYKKKLTAEERKANDEKMKTRVEKSRQEIVDKFIEALEKDEIPWKKPWVGKGRYRNGVSGHVYRGNNVFHLYLAMELLKIKAEKEGRPFDGDPRFFTANNLKEMGKTKAFADKPWEERPHIRAGEKAIWIEHARLVSFETEKEDADGLVEKVQNKFYKVRLIPVFHASQCENVPAMKEEQKFEWNDIERAERIIKANGVEVRNERSDRAFYRPSEDFIGMPMKDQFKSPEEYYATVLHEVVHSTGHSSRLNRENMNFFGDPKYAREELVAQTGSAFLCASIGIMTESTFEDDQSYIQNWIQVLKNNPNEIFEAARKADDAVAYLFNKELEYAKEQGLPKEEIAKIQECIRPVSDSSYRKESKPKTMPSGKDNAPEGMSM